eukprot:TRINITY_DN23101_c0_g1_i1.p2 TRINITY_DN23101_c0_g1~~TRINITY_DN23101_c0_g1_i1.p2  ORF type:complete len:165 (+),score=28.85 TRINITY_DN23101_c0_g1_i1:112-606(+)
MGNALVSSACCCQEDQVDAEHIKTAKVSAVATKFSESAGAGADGSWLETSEPPDADEILQVVHEDIADPKEQPVNRVVITFRLPDNSEKDIVFLEKPWGIDCKPSRVSCEPVMVTWVTPGSHAEELGVKEKWLAVRLDGEDITQEHTDVMMLFQKKAHTLPHRK